MQSKPDFTMPTIWLPCNSPRNTAAVVFTNSWMKQSEYKILSRSDWKKYFGITINEQCPGINPPVSMGRNDEFPQLVYKSDVLRPQSKLMQPTAVLNFATIIIIKKNACIPFLAWFSITCCSPGSLPFASQWPCYNKEAWKTSLISVSPRSLTAQWLGNMHRKWEIWF